MSNTAFDKRVNGAIAAALLCATVSACGTDTVVKPPETPVLSAVAVNPTSVAGGTGSTGTVTVTLAPTAGLPVALSSSNGAATVPSTVTVSSGATSATFPVTTSAVGADTSVTITGTLNGTARTATLLLTAPAVVQPPPPPPATSFTAVLRVVSLSAAKRKNQNGTVTDIPGKPAGTLNTCPIVPDGNGQRIDCELDATGSTSPNGIAKYRYKWRITTIDGDSGEVTVSKFRPPAQPCGDFGNLGNDGSNNDPFVQMRVVLEITSPAGGAPASVTLDNVSVFPAGQCGAAF